jgi:pyroglutamyl-peptidase
MAASRQNLSVEVVVNNEYIQSTDIPFKDGGENCGIRTLQTIVNVEQLISQAEAVEISYDCGKFVYECLYYSLFVHFPILNQETLLGILADCVLIINQLVRGNREQGTGS